MSCVDAFKNLYVEVKQSGEVFTAPCCLVSGTLESNLDFYAPEHLKKIRRQFVMGEKPEECRHCFDPERRGLGSRRLSSNQWYRDQGIFDTAEELVRLDYHVGDTCNLRCVTCGPDNSTSWQAELGVYQKENVVKSGAWRNLSMDKIRHIHFTGGEPLMNLHHLEMLRHIKNKSEVSLNYNTNATILPTAELLALWSEFRLVQLDFSIDAVGSQFEYLRYPAVWNKVVDNLGVFYDRSPPNVMFAVNTTVSILNALSYQVLLDWLCANFQTNRVTDPVHYRFQLANHEFLSISSLPHRLYGELPAVLNIDQSKLSPNDEALKVAKSFLEELDARRGTNHKELFTHLQ